MSDIYSTLCEICTEGNVFCDEPMRNHTTFRVGGPAKYFVTPENNEQIKNLVDYLRTNAIEYYITGNGSNLLVSDEGYDGVIINIAKKHSNIYIKDNMIVAEAGALLSRIGKVALEHELTGFEFATGIPGCIGGAVVMNAGAYGGELKDCLVECKVIDKNGNIIILSNKELELEYRDSIISKEGYIVLEATIQLQEGNRTDIESRLKELAFQRKSKQPLEYPSAGSTFKRPTGYFAGKLIEDCGLRGYRVGDMAVSEKHCGFVINLGNATAKDFMELTDNVKEKVKENFDVDLSLEVKLLGF